jgi:hypothetical protein
MKHANYTIENWTPLSGKRSTGPESQFSGVLMANKAAVDNKGSS